MRISRKTFINLIIITSIGSSILSVLCSNIYPSIPTLYLKSATSDLNMVRTGNYTFVSLFSANGMHIVGDYAYIIGDGNLLILDITNPYNPSYVGDISTPIGMHGDVHVVGDYACIAGTSADFKIINVSDPENPILLDQYIDGGLAWGIYAEDMYAYVASESYGLEIINFTDPTNVDEIGEFDDPTGLPYDVQVVGSLAYIADWNGGLEIVNVSDPTAPVQVSQTTNVTDQAWGIYVEGDYAYLADWTHGLRILNVSDPAFPIEISSIGGYTAYEVYVDGKFAYVTNNGWDAVTVYDISNKLDPFLAGQYTTYQSLVDIEVHDSYIYALSGQNLFVLQGSEVEHSITITSPTGGVSWYKSQIYDITWITQGSNLHTIEIDLYLNGIFLENIHPSTISDGSFSWTVPEYLESSSMYQIKITNVMDETTFGMSDYFTILLESEDKKIPSYDIPILIGIIGITIFFLGYQSKYQKN